MIKNKIVLFLATLLTLVSCSKNNKPLETFLGEWGQVAQLEKLNPTSLFLLFIEPTQTYEVCVASHLVEAHPNILTEIDASVKIWGRYINRDLQTNVYQQTIPLPPKTDHQDTTFEKLTTACPDADIVVGYGNINSVGLTANRYSYFTDANGMHTPRNGKRILLLQSPIFAGATWHSYVNDQNPFSNTEDLIANIMEREHHHILEQPNHFSTLIILMHEFGHVWGLCDMYPLSGGHTNCDPIWSRKDDNGNILLVPDAKMAAAGWKNPAFLHDDDIEGIRTLANRDRFHSLWKDQRNFPQILPAKEANFLFKFRSFDKQDNTFTFNFALFTKEAITLTLKLNTDRGPLNYQPMTLNGPIDTNQYGIRLPEPAGVIVESVEAIIKDSQGNTLETVNAKPSK